MSRIHDLYRTNKYKFVLISFLIILGIILFKEMRVYMSSFLSAATLYVLLRGQMAHMVEKWKMRKGLAALLLTLEGLLFFLIPLTGVAFLVIDTVTGITIDPREILEGMNRFVESLESKLEFKIFTPENLSSLPKIGGNILQSLGAGIYSLIINSIFSMFILFYMLVNYDDFAKMVKEILPLREDNKQILGEETKLIIQANAIGIPLLAIIQGVFAYIGYMFFGINSALLYGILTGFATIIPVIGTAVIWVPLSIGVIMGGDIAYGIGIGLYGLFIIGGVDNVARLFLQKWLADIHPLITILGVIIGIPMFGFWGVIFGPLLLSLFVLFFNMYRHDFIPGSDAQPHVCTRPKVAETVLPTLEEKVGSLDKRVRKKSKKEDNNKNDNKNEL